MVTILPALRQVREDLVKILDRDTVERLCQQLGYHWRSRQLDPWTTMHLFILQVLNKNTAMAHLPHLSGERFTASAYCQARQRLPLELLERVVNQFGQQLDHPGASSLWHGHRVLLEDGSGFSMPDTAELQAYFGQPGNQKPGCGFPVAHLLTLFDAQAGFLRTRKKGQKRMALPSVGQGLTTIRHPFLHPSGLRHPRRRLKTAILPSKPRQCHSGQKPFSMKPA